MSRKHAGPISILKNVVSNRGNWISFRVRNQAGVDSIGAMVELLLMDGTKRFRRVITSRGYASSQDPTIHVGLGTQKVQQAIISWPDGSTQTLQSPAIGKVHDIQYVE